MLYHDYLEVLLGSRVKIKVLRTLWRHRGKEFTIRELADFLGVSHTGVRKALGDLYEMNAIRVRAVGRSHAVALNSRSYCAGIVEKMFGMEGETMEDLVGTLRRRLRGRAVASALVFGSVARGDETPLSDIDLFVVAEDREKAEVAISEVQGEVSDRFGNGIVPYVFSKADLTDENRKQILEEIGKNHVVVLGDVWSRIVNVSEN